MTRETELSRLVAMAHMRRAEERARDLARATGVASFIVRGMDGLRIVQRPPPFGEFWRAQPSGQITHVAGPVI
jgi:hypothetical protein